MGAPGQTKLWGGGGAPQNKRTLEMRSPGQFPLTPFNVLLFLVSLIKQINF